MFLARPSGLTRTEELASYKFFNRGKTSFGPPFELFVFYSSKFKKKTLCGFRLGGFRFLPDSGFSW